MNYLAHALPHLDDPWVVAGTSLPDWLRAVDRRARVRPAQLAALTLADGSAAARLRVGVLQHHEDDARFHADARFDALAAELTLALRALEPAPRFRASTIAHVLVEMLVDAALLEARPASGERYYAALAGLDRDALAEHARSFSGAPLPHLPTLFDRFLRARFILNYATDDGVVGALDGVLWRTGLPPLPHGVEEVVARARPRVAALAAELFP